MSSHPRHQQINIHSNTSKVNPNTNGNDSNKQQTSRNAPTSSTTSATSLSTATSEASSSVVLSTPKKIRKAWNQFEIRLIKAADASKVDARKVKENPNAASSQSRILDVRTKCFELVQAREDLRILLHEAEANVKDNAGELNALKLMSKSSGCFISSGSGKRGSWGGRALKRRKVE